MTIGSAAYWKKRALAAEASLQEYLDRNLSEAKKVMNFKESDAVRRLREQNELNRSWELENYRRDAQDRRDREIGEMGGGG